MNAQTTETDGAPNVAPVYLVMEGEFRIEAPLKAVWSHVLNYPSWQNFPVHKHVSGPPAGEGEVVMLRKEEKGFTFPAYYALTIKLDPESRVLWKTYPAEKGSEVEFFGIVEFRVREAQGGTRFSYNFLYEFQVPYQQESELEAFRKQQYENFTILLSSIFPKLKRLAEQIG